MRFQLNNVYLFVRLKMFLLMTFVLTYNPRPMALVNVSQSFNIGAMLTLSDVFVYNK